MKRTIAVSEETHLLLRHLKEDKIMSTKKFDWTYDKVLREMLEQCH